MTTSTRLKTTAKSQTFDFEAGQTPTVKRTLTLRIEHGPGEHVERAQRVLWARLVDVAETARSIYAWADDKSEVLALVDAVASIDVTTAVDFGVAVMRLHEVANELAILRDREQPLVADDFEGTLASYFGSAADDDEKTPA